MNLWPVEHIFPQFGVPYSIQVPQIECSRKEVTSFKIHILAEWPFLCKQTNNQTNGLIDTTLTDDTL